MLFLGGDQINYIKSCIPWVGGKFKLLNVINKLLPKKVEQFVDVFGGSATVTLNTYADSGCRHIYNDFNGDLVNLFHCVKEHPLALIEELGFLPLNSRQEFDILLKGLKGQPFSSEYQKSETELAQIYFNPPERDELLALYAEQAQRGDVKRAANFYKTLRYSFNANGKTYGAKPCDIRRYFKDIRNCSERLSNANIEHKDFEELIKQYDMMGNVFYCDPPYYEAEGFYAVIFPKTDHQRLHDVLASCRSFVMVSYNYCPYICELYKEFYIYYTKRPNSMSHKAGDEYEEIVITNYDPRKFIPNIQQTSLFDDDGEESEVELILIHEPENKKYIKEV